MSNLNQRQRDRLAKYVKRWELRRVELTHAQNSEAEAHRNAHRVSLQYKRAGERVALAEAETTRRQVFFDEAHSLLLEALINDD
jgi:hypothetical protein